jgi:hypothetical protein
MNILQTWFDKSGASVHKGCCIFLLSQNLIKSAIFNIFAVCTRFLQMSQYISRKSNLRKTVLRVLREIKKTRKNMFYAIHDLCLSTYHMTIYFYCLRAIFAYLISFM